MSIYESLRQSAVNDFGFGERFESYPRIPCLNADQPAEIVGLTAPDKRPSPETLNLAPPFERFFIECRMPKPLQVPSVQTVIGDGSIARSEGTIVEVGMDVRIQQKAKYEKTPDDMHPRWHLNCLPFYKVESNKAVAASPLCISNFHFCLTLGSDGFPVNIGKAEDLENELNQQFLDSGRMFWVGQDGMVYGLTAGYRYGDTDAWQDALKAKGGTDIVNKKLLDQFSLYFPLLYAVNSLHNKRTMVVQNQPSRQVRRAAQRNGKQTPDQRTIVIKDFVQIMQGACKAQSDGHQYPLCEVIGHYVNYGVNGRTGLLFGKYRGTFFVPSFLKGNPNVGATDHDYVIGKRTKAA